MAIGKKRNNSYGKVTKVKGTKYRSGYEGEIAKSLNRKNINYTYEEDKYSYEVIEIKTYNPDFKLPNGIYIEAKGVFSAKDRKKHLLIQKQYPELDVRFLFQKASNKINKNSKTTYADWCDKNNFIWAEGTVVPKEWIDEKAKK